MRKLLEKTGAIGQEVVVVVVSAIVLKSLAGLGEFNIMRDIFQRFVVELWPIWIGVALATLYGLGKWIYKTTKQTTERLNKIDERYWKSEEAHIKRFSEFIEQISDDNRETHDGIN